MSWLMRVIGRVLGTTQTVTLACQTQDGQNGGNNNIVEQLKPVSKELKPKRSRVPQGTQGQSRKTETSCVPIPTKKSSTNGTRSATPVSQPVKPKRKPKSSVAQSTTQGKLSKQEPKSALKTHGQAGQRKTTVSKTPQPALQAKTRKQKAVDSTTRVKKGTQSKTLAQTPTGRSSKVHGS